VRITRLLLAPADPSRPPERDRPEAAFGFRLHRRFFRLRGCKRAGPGGALHERSARRQTDSSLRDAAPRERKISTRRFLAPSRVTDRREAAAAAAPCEPVPARGFAARRPKRSR